MAHDQHQAMPGADDETGIRSSSDPWGSLRQLQTSYEWQEAAQQQHAHRQFEIESRVINQQLDGAMDRFSSFSMGFGGAPLPSPSANLPLQDGPFEQQYSQPAQAHFHQPSHESHFQERRPSLVPTFYHHQQYQQQAAPPPPPEATHQYASYSMPSGRPRTTAPLETEPLPLQSQHQYAPAHAYAGPPVPYSSFSSFSSGYSVDLSAAMGGHHGSQPSTASMQHGNFSDPQSAASCSPHPLHLHNHHRDWSTASSGSVVKLGAETSATALHQNSSYADARQRTPSWTNYQPVPLPSPSPMFQQMQQQQHQRLSLSNQHRFPQPPHLTWQPTPPPSFPPWGSGWSPPSVDEANAGALAVSGLSKSSAVPSHFDPYSFSTPDSQPPYPAPPLQQALDEPLHLSSDLSASQGGLQSYPHSLHDAAGTPAPSPKTTVDGNPYDSAELGHVLESGPPLVPLSGALRPSARSFDSAVHQQDLSPATAIPPKAVSSRSPTPPPIASSSKAADGASRPPSTVIPQLISFAKANELAESSIRASGAAKQSKKSKTKAASTSRFPGDGSAPTVDDVTAESAAAKVANERRLNKKLTVEEDCNCRTCSKPIARLIIRARQAELDVPHTPVFDCLACLKSSPTGGNSTGEDVSVLAFRANLTATFRKRPKRSESSQLTACDVCLRDVASGSVQADDSRTAVTFPVEIVCVSCSEKYQRCTDCGGGGGVRLGVGKWRSKALFTDSRKTCSLSHLRLGAFSEMVYDVWAITEIPRAELQSVVDVCGSIFQNTMLSGMAIPEVIENKTAIAFTYEAILNMAVMGWKALSRLVQEDIEGTRGIRRYVALRSCARNPRKGTRPKLPEPVVETQVLHAGKDIVGFITCEYDIAKGTIFLACLMPWATGETYDATTILIQALLRRIEKDRDEINRQHIAQGLPEVASLDHLWTLMFFKQESRMMHHLQKKRGFAPLRDYIEKYPDTDVTAFPPHREVYLPVASQAGWEVLVRRQGPSASDDWYPRQSESRAKEQQTRSRKPDPASQ